MSHETVVILAHRADAGAAALAAALRRHDAQVWLLDEHVLSASVVRHHPDSGRVEPASRPGSDRRDEVAVPEGPVINATTDVVLCRLPVLAPVRFTVAGDGEYAAQELFALALSWLHGLGDAVVNPPSPRALSGALPDRWSLHALAAGVGLGTPRTRAWSNGAHAGVPAGPAGPPLPAPGEWVEHVDALSPCLVCGDAVVGAPAGLGEQAVDLVHASGLEVAEVTFGVPTSRDMSSDGRPGATRPLVLGVDPVPRLLDPRHVEANAEHLLRTASARRTHARTLGMPA